MSVYPSASSLRFSPQRLSASIDWHGHLCFAAWLMETIRPHTLVELGVFRGDSLAAFAQAASQFNVSCNITGIDTWGGDSTTGKYDESVYNEVKDYFDTQHPNVTLFRSLFDDALPRFTERSIDILHIDGCHHYEAVKHDYETWKSKMSDRGIILFHDISVISGGFGTKQFWDEIKADYPSFSFSHSNGLGVLLIGSSQPSQLMQLVTDMAKLEQVRAAFEATGAKFFNLAKQKWWQAEAQKHAAYVTHMTGDMGRQLARSVENLVDRYLTEATLQASGVQPSQPKVTPSLIRRIASACLRTLGMHR